MGQAAATQRKDHHLAVEAEDQPPSTAEHTLVDWLIYLGHDMALPKGLELEPDGAVVTEF